MKQIHIYFTVAALISNILLAEMSYAFTEMSYKITGIKTLETQQSTRWFFIRPGGSDLPLELVINGKNNISAQNLGAFNGIANKDRSIFFKVEKGFNIHSLAVFGTKKIKTPRSPLAINSALHFSNGATYEFRDATNSTNQNWENLSGNNLSGTITVTPSTETHIDGYVSYDGSGVFTYPVGAGTNGYHPLTVNGRAGQTITIAWLFGDPGENKDSTDNEKAHSRSSLTGDLKSIYPSGQWDWHIRNTSIALTNSTTPINVAPSGSISISAPIPSDIDLITKGIPENLKLVGWNGTSWEALDNTVSSSGIITASTNKAFSAITFGAVDTGGPLPINLISFSAIQGENNVVLYWETTSEINSRNFEIQHSANSKSWEKIGTVDALGSSDKLLKYEFIDTNPLTGKNFYRLKMIDTDNTSAYSRIITVNSESSKGILLYPNPVSETLSIKPDYDWNKVVNVSIYNLTGQIMYTSSSKPSSSIDVRGLSAGKYIVLITSSTGHKNSYNILVMR